MFYFYLFYLFFIPLEIYQYRMSKGPTGINYETLSMVFLTGWLLMGRPNAAKMRLTPSPLNKVVLALFLSTAIGMAFGYAQFPYDQTMNVFDFNSLSAKRLTYIYTGFLLFWLGANMLNTRKKIRWAMFAMALSAPLVVRAFRSDLSGVSAWHYSDDMRVKGPFRSIGSNELGAYFVFSAVMMLMALFYTKDWKARALYLFGGCGYVYGILYCYSRATQLSFGLCVALVATIRHRWVLVLIVLALGTTSYWLPQSVVDRWNMTENAEGELDESAQNRKIFWQLALEFWEASPIIGQGVGTFVLMNPAKLDTHNMYYRMLAEQGLIGITIFMVMWVLLLRLGYELWQGGKTKFDRGYGFSLMVATFGLMICNYFGDRFTHLALIGQYWTFVGIGVRLRSHMLGYEPLADDEATAGAEGVQGLEGPHNNFAPANPGGWSPAAQPALARGGGWRRASLLLLGAPGATPGSKLKLVSAKPAPPKPPRAAGPLELPAKAVGGARQAEFQRPRLNLVGRPTSTKFNT